MACSFLIRLFAFILFVVPIALANVYITEPWAESVWTAGQCQKLTWKDDAHAPHLAHMAGSAVADLHNENDEYVASVRIENLQSGSASVCLPDPCSESLIYKGLIYDVRIIWKNHVLSWSHSFHIMNTECQDSKNPDHPQALAAQAVEDNDSTSTSYSKGIVSSSQTSTAAPSATSYTKPSIPTSYTVSANSPSSFGVRNSGSSRFSKGGHWLDFEKLKFRFVFIVWPALIGISMAM